MKLSALIRKRREELELTWPKMVKRAEQAGWPITRNYLMQLANEDTELKTAPGREILHAVAAATGLSVHEVWAAAGESLGVYVQEPVQTEDGGQLFVALTQGRTPEEREWLAEQVRQQVRLLDLARSAQPPTPGEHTES